MFDFGLASQYDYRDALIPKRIRCRVCSRPLSYRTYYADGKTALHCVYCQQRGDGDGDQYVQVGQRIISKEKDRWIKGLFHVYV